MCHRDPSFKKAITFMQCKKTKDVSFDALVPFYDVKRPVDWYECFGRKVPVLVEIGSGLGEFIVKKASENVKNNFVGIELEWERNKRCLRKIDAGKKAEGKEFVDNIKILQLDAVVAFERLFRQKTIDKIYCLFPCPWPKKKHAKYRLFSNDHLKLVNSRLIDDGNVMLVTDSEPYLEWISKQVNSGGTGFDFFTKKIKPQFNTKFEKKWCQSGQQEFFEIILQKNKHIKVPLKEDVELKSYFASNFNPDTVNFKDISGDVSIVLKDFLFDQKKKKAMLHLIVSEKTIMQHLGIAVVKSSKGWRVSKAEGYPALPTKGVAKAIESVYKAIEDAGAK